MTILTRKNLGFLGEWLVKNMYLSAGYALQQTNKSFRFTEVDLVFTKDGIVQLLEVKLVSSKHSFVEESWFQKQSYKLKKVRKFYESEFPNKNISIHLVILDFSQKKFITLRRYVF